MKLMAGIITSASLRATLAILLLLAVGEVRAREQAGNKVEIFQTHGKQVCVHLIVIAGL